MQYKLVEYLVTVYEFSERSAQALVDAGLVLPIIDGLDELDATDQPGYTSRAGLMVRAINGYQRFRSPAPLIVTCRSSHYQALTDDHNGLRDAALAEILPLTGQQVRDFVTYRAVAPHRWRGVLDHLDADRQGHMAAGPRALSRWGSRRPSPSSPSMGWRALDMRLCCCAPAAGAGIGYHSGSGGSSTNAGGPDCCGSRASATSSGIESCRTISRRTGPRPLRRRHPGCLCDLAVCASEQSVSRASTMSSTSRWPSATPWTFDGPFHCMIDTNTLLDW